MSTTYEQPVLPVADPGRFGLVHAAVASAFSSTGVAGFLRSLERASLRIRDFEDVLRRELLGEVAVIEYGQLGNSDQGQIREFYLASLERVAPELRQKFFKLYAYY